MIGFYIARVPPVVEVKPSVVILGNGDYEFH